MKALSLMNEKKLPHYVFMVRKINKKPLESFIFIRSYNRASINEKNKFQAIISFIINYFYFFFIYSIFINKKKLEQKIDLETKEESFTNSNILKNIKYSSKDLKEMNMSS